jgi:diacylglycerol kinase family enzyme
MLIISNPVAGDKKGSLLLKEYVIPLLKRHTSPGLPIDFEETSAPGDAGVIASRYLKSITEETIKEDPVIVISGGDTTIKELVNGITGIKQPTTVVIIPSGTANALYHSLFPSNVREASIQQLAPQIRGEAGAMPEEVQSKLFAVFSFLSGGVTRRLYSTRTEILDANAKVVNWIISCVVVSSCQSAISVM